MGHPSNKHERRKLANKKVKKPKQTIKNYTFDEDDDFEYNADTLDMLEDMYNNKGNYSDEEEIY